MFKHRSRNSLPPPVVAPGDRGAAGADAARAASSQGSAAAAAAAAALRAHPAPLTDPSTFDTRRMQRRRSSVSSTGSRHSERFPPLPAPAPAPAPELRRRNSSGSMSDRTFRSRSQSPVSRRRGSEEDAGEHVPPVPSLPENLQQGDQAEHESGPSRGGEDGTQDGDGKMRPLLPPLVVASARRRRGGGGSGGGGGIGSWHGPPAAAPDWKSHVRTSDTPMQLSSARPIVSAPLGPAAPRSTSPPPPPSSGSVNFSYPRAVSPRPGSDNPEDQHILIYDPNTRRMRPKSQVQAEAQLLWQAEERTAERRRSSMIKGAKTGRNAAAAGSVSAAAAAAAAGRTKLPNSGEGGTRPPPPSQPSGNAVVESKSKSKPTTSIPAKTLEPYSPPTHPPVLAHAPAPAPAPAPALAPSPPPPPSTRPNSFDRTGREQDILPRVTTPSQPAETMNPSAPPISSESVLTEDPAEESELEAHELADDQGATARREALQKLDGLPTKTTATTPHSTQEGARLPVELDSQARSLAPARPEAGGTPITGPTPDPSPQPSPAQSPERRPRRRQTDSPCRSPTRSARFTSTPEHLAVIHSPPPRSASPRKSALKHSSSPTRYMSDDSSEASAELTMSRKKPARVSFDDEHTVVGEAASALTSDADSTKSPSPTGMKRWFIGLGKSRRDLSPLDEDETMKPRPALPLFSSVREKKATREPEDRPLVRPHDPVSSSSSSPSPSRLLRPVPNGTNGTNDDSGASSASLSSKHEANTSRYREPLPPVATSAEEPASSDGDDDDDGDSDQSHLSNSEEEAGGDGEDEETELDAEVKPPAPAPAPTPTPIPMIALQPATPRRAGTPESEQFFDMPGRFPIHDETETGLAKAATRTAAAAAVATAADGDDNREASDDSSIYSDAYEDLSDLDENGFMSLDAVLSTRVEQPTESEAAARPMESRPSSAAAATGHTAAATSDDWEMVKAYWKNLSAEKRKQLEKEALEEAADAGDLDEMGAPEPRRTKKKKDKSKAVEIQQQPEPQPQPLLLPQQPQPHVNPDRVYQIKPGTKVLPAVESADGGEQGNGASVRLQKSMRQGRSGDGEDAEGLSSATKLGSTIRSAQAPASPEPASSSRPAPAPAPSSSALQKGGRRRHQPADPTTSQAMAAALMNHAAITRSRRNSDSSESSFQRFRPASASSGGFRKTLRGSNPTRATAAPDPTPVPASRTAASDDERNGDRGGRHRKFSIRSLSPAGLSSPGHRRGGTPVSMEMNGSGGAMRMSLRSGSGETASSPSRHRMHLPLLGKRGGSKKKLKKNKGGLASRFDDSSDEDGGATAPPFTSRFDDSSDEENTETKPAKQHDRKAVLTKSTRSRPSSSASAMPTTPAPIPRPATAPGGQEIRQRQESESPNLGSSENETAVAPASPQPSGAQTQTGHSPSLPAPMNDITSLQHKRSTRAQRELSPSSHPSLGTQAMFTTAIASGGTGNDNLAKSGGGGGGGSGQPSRRSSIMSVLRRKKADPAGTQHKIGRRQGESGARVDTSLERTPDELSALRAGGSELLHKRRGVTAPPPQGHRRSISDGNWPLPQPSLGRAEDDTSETTTATTTTGPADEEETEEKRPFSADGIMHKHLGRRRKQQQQHQPPPPPGPGSVQRRSTYQGVAVAGGGDGDSNGDGDSVGVDSTGTPRRKRFSGLRRIFRLEG